MHQFVHDKGCASHVATVFHERNEEVKDENLRQKHDNRAHAGNNSLNQEVFNCTIGKVAVYPFS